MSIRKVEQYEVRCGDCGTTVMQRNDSLPNGWALVNRGECGSHYCGGHWSEVCGACAALRSCGPTAG